MLVRRLSGCESWERGHDNTMTSREHNCTFKFVIGLYFMHRIRSSPRKNYIDLIDSSQENEMKDMKPENLKWKYSDWYPKNRGKIRMLKCLAYNLVTPPLSKVDAARVHPPSAPLQPRVVRLDHQLACPNLAIDH